MASSKFMEYRGLSTDFDAKPTKADGVKNGDSFIEMDTGKLYFYSEIHEEWLEFGVSGSGSSDEGVVDV